MWLREWAISFNVNDWLFQPLWEYVFRNQENQELSIRALNLEASFSDLVANRKSFLLFSWSKWIWSLFLYLTAICNTKKWETWMWIRALKSFYSLACAMHPFVILLAVRIIVCPCDNGSLLCTSLHKHLCIFTQSCPHNLVRNHC